MDSRKVAIKKALEDLESTLNLSVNAAARAHNVKRTTLRRRLAGGTNRRIAHEQEQRPTPRQEDFLSDWILEQDSQGYPPSHRRAREMATRVLRSNGDDKPLGKD